MNIFKNINLIPIDLTDMSSIMQAIEISNPDEVYNLAAQSFVEASFEQPIATAEVSGIATTAFLEGIRQIKKEAKFYQASSSEMYGATGNDGKPLNERSPFSPMSPYAAAKLFANWTTIIYRKAYGIFACNGILFNHESPLRGMEFVTRKITNSVAKISLGLETKLLLGNLSARRDWGYAPEYVEAMWRMLQREKPDDYVIATGKAHSVREFARRAFETLGLNWKRYVKTDRRFLRPLDVDCLVGDSSKARKELNWAPRTDFSKLVTLMVEEDASRWKKCLEGKNLPWDAPNYPSEARILTRAMKM